MDRIGVARLADHDARRSGVGSGRCPERSRSTPSTLASAAIRKTVWSRSGPDARVENVTAGGVGKRWYVMARATCSGRGRLADGRTGLGRDGVPNGAPVGCRRERRVDGTRPRQSSTGHRNRTMDCFVGIVDPGNPGQHHRGVGNRASDREPDDHPLAKDPNGQWRLLPWLGGQNRVPISDRVAVGGRGARTVARPAR